MCSAFSFVLSRCLPSKLLSPPAPSAIPLDAAGLPNVVLNPAHNAFTNVGVATATACRIAIHLRNDATRGACVSGHRELAVTSAKHLLPRRAAQVAAWAGNINGTHRAYAWGRR